MGFGSIPVVAQRKRVILSVAFEVIAEIHLISEKSIDPALRSLITPASGLGSKLIWQFLRGRSMQLRFPEMIQI
jgi:hypothetical protein